MPRRRTRIPLAVYLNGRLVGRVQRQSSGAIDFQYDPTWLDWEHAFPLSLSLPLREDRFIGDRVTAVLDNLLPDSDDVRRRLAERTAAAGSDAYSLLSAIGRDCVGALQFLPEGVDPGPAGGVSGRRVSDGEIAAILGDLVTSPLGIQGDDEFRISIAGAQEKTALLFWKGRWHIPHGSTATTHILKPQIGRRPSGLDLSRSVENEHLCLRLAMGFGLPVAHTEIQDFDGNRALVIERFDRRWTRDRRLLRLPLEDCCQALSVPPSRKYETDGGPGIGRVLDLLKGSDDPELDRRLFLKAQMVFWLLGAPDGHAKNFSIFLLPGGRFRLTPLYDVMSAQPAVDAGQIPRNKMKLAMAIGDKRHYPIQAILPRHFMQSAVKAGIAIATVEQIFIELREQAAAAIDAALTHLPPDFPQDLAASITKGMRRRLRQFNSARRGE
jgi:serine/threonine-protein kinase HipA